MNGGGLDNYSNYGGSTDHANMYVLLGRNRDSGCLENSNFDTALEALGGESKHVQVHRFNHWAVGWTELILIDPAADDKVKTAEEINCSLADYPVLDEEDFSRRETEEENETYEQNIRREIYGIVEDITGLEYLLDKDIEEILSEDDIDAIFHNVTEDNGIYWEHDSGGCYINIDAIRKAIKLEDWAGVTKGKKGPLFWCNDIVSLIKMSDSI